MVFKNVFIACYKLTAISNLDLIIFRVKVKCFASNFRCFAVVVICHLNVDM